MIKKTDDFFNKVAKELKAAYFPTENHGWTENKNYWKTVHALENFNNGCLAYGKLIHTLSKSCNDTKPNIHKRVEKYIDSFGEYKYLVNAATEKE